MGCAGKVEVMITVKAMIESLERYPEDALCHATILDDDLEGIDVCTAGTVETIPLEYYEERDKIIRARPTGKRRQMHTLLGFVSTKGD